MHVLWRHIGAPGTEAHIIALVDVLRPLLYGQLSFSFVDVQRLRGLLDLLAALAATLATHLGNFSDTRGHATTSPPSLVAL